MLTLTDQVCAKHYSVLCMGLQLDQDSVPNPAEFI